MRYLTDRSGQMYIAQHVAGRPQAAVQMFLSLGQAVLVVHAENWTCPVTSENIMSEEPLPSPVKGQIERKKIWCNRCRGLTIHDLIFNHVQQQVDVLDKDAVDDLDTALVYLWACRGCERATMQEISIDQNGEEIGSEFYPSREKHHHLRKSFLQLNVKLSAIYEEIVISYNHGSLILCATGLRALLEGVCAEKNIVGQNLYSKINNLNTLLPGNIVENLHHFRFIGNEAVHNLTAPTLGELRLAIEVMEDVLNFLYDLDYKAASLSQVAGADSGSQQQIQPNSKVIRRILERSPSLAFGPQDLFRVLYKAGNNGLKYEDIADQMGRTSSQLSGVLGALGKRINNTTGVEGKPGVTYLLQIVRAIDGDPGAWGWSMRHELMQVIRDGNYAWAKEWK